MTEDTYARIPTAEQVQQYLMEVLPDSLVLGFDPDENTVLHSFAARELGFVSSLARLLPSTTTLDLYLGLKFADLAVVTDAQRWMVIYRGRDWPNNSADRPIMYIEAPESLAKLKEWAQAVRDLEGHGSE